MKKSNAPKPSQSTVTEPKVTSQDKQAPLEGTPHVFEHWHWVNEACGDDLWDI